MIDIPGVRLVSAGRLDKESEGLLILTNDGDLIDKMMRAANEHEKEYIVKLDRNIEIEDLNKALDGLYIDMPKPYKIKRYDLIPRTRNFIKVTLTEGKNREIRKIFSFLGYDVKSLTRIRIGCVELDDLETGEWRNLTQKEIKGLLSGKDNSKAVKPNKVRVVRPKREE